MNKVIAKEDENIQDPDYIKTEVDQIQERVKEENDNKERLEKVKSIINREFNRELKMRENQLENVQKRILKTKKTLHLLRYILVKSYYNAHEVNCTEQDVSEQANISAQNRIHPALKKLLDNNSDSNYLYNTLNVRSKRKKRNESVNVDKALSAVEKEPKEINQIDVKTEKEVVTNTDLIMSDARHRGKIKHRLIIGNISKWMPSENEEDNSTHKWMVYVRGPKESPDVNHIIKKIIFYLHPSYKPNDVVEVTESPFHLSRRGWGEFPLRIQIHFNCKLNKPIDVIHNLKLDKTYTGRQTLGNEMLVDIYLYKGVEQDETDIESTCDGNVIEDEVTEDINDVTSFNEFDKQNELTSSDEINEINYENVHEKPNLTIEENQIKLESDSNYYYNRHINLDHNYAKCDNSFVSVLKRKRESSISNNHDEKRFQSDNDRTDLIDIPIGYFNTVIELLPYLLKRISLIRNETNIINSSNGDLPFMANSFAEYYNWNSMKQISCEWSRAKYIKRLIRKTNVVDENLWSVKNILYYARTHGYTPLNNRKLLLNNSKFMERQSSLENTVKRIKKDNNNFHLNIKDEKIDVIEFEQEDENVKMNLDRSVNYNVLVEDDDTVDDCNNEGMFSFIRQASLDVGVILKPEELIPDVTINGCERILLAAVKCLAENIIRDTHSTMLLENRGNHTTSYITSEDIYRSLKNSRLGIFIK